MQTAHIKAVTHDLPIEFQARLDKLREYADQHAVSKETVMIHETRMWVAFLRTLWPAACITASRVDWINAKCPEFQLNVEPGPDASNTVLKHITSANMIWLYDGKYLAFVRRMTRWAWRRIQAHRAEWFDQTLEGQVLQEATQRLKRTLDRAYAEFAWTQDDRIYPLGKVGDFFGASVRNRWTDDLRAALRPHVRMFSFADFKIVLHPNRRLGTSDALEGTHRSWSEVMRILARADRDLNASLAHWREHYQGVPYTEEEDDTHDADHAADYDLYHIPALRGSKYGRKLRTGQ